MQTINPNTSNSTDYLLADSSICFVSITGEPMNNYKNVMHAISRINSELGIGARHITLSTVGVVPKIKRLADENIQVRIKI